MRYDSEDILRLIVFVATAIAGLTVVGLFLAVLIVVF